MKRMIKRIVSHEFTDIVGIAFCCKWLFNLSVTEGCALTGLIIFTSGYIAKIYFICRE